MSTPRWLQKLSLQSKRLKRLPKSTGSMKTGIDGWWRKRSVNAKSSERNKWCKCSRANSIRNWWICARKQVSRCYKQMVRKHISKSKCLPNWNTRLRTKIYWASNRWEIRFTEKNKNAWTLLTNLTKANTKKERSTTNSVQTLFVRMSKSDRVQLNKWKLLSKVYWTSFIRRIRIKPKRFKLYKRPFKKVNPHMLKD